MEKVKKLPKKAEPGEQFQKETIRNKKKYLYTYERNTKNRPKWKIVKTERIEEPENILEEIGLDKHTIQTIIQNVPEENIKEFIQESIRNQVIDSDSPEEMKTTQDIESYIGELTSRVAHLEMDNEHLKKMMAQESEQKRNYRRANELNKARADQSTAALSKAQEKLIELNAISMNTSMENLANTSQKYMQKSMLDSYMRTVERLRDKLEKANSLEEMEKAKEDVLTTMRELSLIKNESEPVSEPNEMDATQA